MSNLDLINKVANQATFSTDQYFKAPSENHHLADLNFVVSLKHNKSCPLQIGPAIKK